MLFCALTAEKCILASFLLRVHPLKCTSLLISLPPTLLPFSSPSLRRSLLPPLASSLTSFLRSVHDYVPSSLVPFINLPSLPPHPLPPSTHHRFLTPSRCSLPLFSPCSLPPSLPLYLLPSLPPSLPPFLPPSLPPFLPPSLRFSILPRSFRATIPACLPASAV